MCAGSSSGGSCVCEKKTGAGEAGFGFLEFGDVDGSDVEATGFDAGTCARERCREEKRARAFETRRALEPVKAPRGGGSPFRAAGSPPIHRERWRGLRRTSSREDRARRAAK